MKQNSVNNQRSIQRTFALIGGELDGLKVYLIQPQGINLAEGGFFSLPSHLPDHSIILNVYESLGVMNEEGEEFFTFKIATYIRPGK
jgi:hypothetical protein